MVKIKTNSPIVIFLVVAILLIFLHAVGLLSPLENFLSTLTKPLSVHLYGWSSSLNSSYNANQDVEALQGQINRLTKEVSALTVANSGYLETAAENQKLRSTLKFLSVNNFQAVVAGIIAKQSPADDTGDLIINRGRLDGLRPGLGVVSEEGVIIGKVISVKDTSATVCLTTNSNCQLPATIQNELKTQGITVGDLGLTIKMSYIPQGEKISIGDMIITSGLGGNIPRGLLIGKVAQVYNASNEVWQSATIEPLLNFDNLTIVSVIIP
ncbi:MAG: rod shape-determining protein MreC [Patescibacteria group bacterium]|jgi:rod shape-determining protein MreC